MESFQSSVSDFDLNFFDQITNATRATPSVQCPEGRKLSITRLKDRLKSVSQVVQKAQNTNKILIDVQNKLVETKHELEETRNLLFKKNEHEQTIFEERSVYFEQAKQYLNDIQELKERLAKSEQLNHDSEMKDQVINSYIEQVKGLQSELENSEEQRKQDARESSLAIRQVTISKIRMRKQLEKLVKFYVVPTSSPLSIPPTKNDTKWLASLIRQYLPEANKNDETEKIDKKNNVTNNSDEADLDEEEPLVRILTQQNIRTDLDYVESVDTGRGSSLEFSDGEKSFHSPEYYIEDSHDAVTHVCKKCNIPKSDSSTSPMSQDTYILDNSAPKTLCKKCTSQSRIDSCTSPIPTLLQNVATQTSFVITTQGRQNHEIIDKVNFDNVRLNSYTQNTESIDGIVSPYHRIEEKTKKNILMLQDFTFDSDDDSMVEANSRPVSPVEDFNTCLSASIDEVDLVANQDKSSETTSTFKESQNESHIDISFDKSQELNELYKGSKMHSPTLVKIQITATSESENEEPMEIVNRTKSPVQEKSILTPIFDEEISNCSTVILETQSVNESNKSKTECQDLHNSSTINRYISEDSIEIKSILDEMRLHQLITPIPKTPTRSINSPTMPQEVLDIIHNPQVEIIAHDLNEKINLLRSKVTEVFTPFIEILPHCLEKIPCVFGIGQQNQEFLSNLLINPKHMNTDKNCLNTYEENCNNQIPPDVLNLNSDSMLSINNEDDISDTEELSIPVEEDTYEEIAQISTYLPSSMSSNTHHGDVCEINKDKSMYMKYNKKINNTLIEPEASDSTSCIIVNQMDINGPNTYENTKETDNTITNASLSSKDTTMNIIESKKKIVYETASDCDDNLQVDELSQNEDIDSDQVSTKKKRKARKLTKLDKLRKKMEPKGKIKPVLAKSIKKHFKPIPIAPPPYKKRVTESDTAATLNEKSVYENAVKVIAAQKTLSEPKVIVEDCVRFKQYMPFNIIVKKDDKNNNLTNPLPTLTPSTPNKKRKLSKKVTPQKSYDSNCQSPDLDARVEKRKSIRQVSKSPEKNRRKASTDIICDKTPKKLKTKTPDCDKKICVNKSDTTTNKDSVIGENNSHKADLFNNSPDAKKAERKRTTSIVVNDSPKKRNNQNMVPEVQRMLRSASFIKNKDSVCVTTDVADRRELRSNTLIHKSDNKDALQLSPTVKRQRISTIKSTHNDTQKDPGSMISEQKIIANDVKNKEIVCPLRTETAISVPKQDTLQTNNARIVSYADLDLSTNENNETVELLQTDDTPTSKLSRGRKDSLLCLIIMKYGVNKKKFAPKTQPESKLKEISNKLEKSISEIVGTSYAECKSSMKRLVAEIRTWDLKLFILGVIKYLRQPERKIELYNKVISPPAPPMTKNEQVLLYVIDELQKSIEYTNIVEKILTNIEYALFALNKTAEEYDVIEAMSHFYALLCRSRNNISRLRMFIVDAMYCLQMKSILLVQQCLDVWMLVLPLGHTGLAKCPLVICLVYLLHFFKGEDKCNRVRNIRQTLRQKYNYDCADWSEPQILELFTTAITEIKESPNDRKILRLALLILAKRNGAVWCHNNIVKNMLQPLIDNGKATDSAKRFAVSLLGPLLKPYPSNMKVHCELATDYLMTMLEQTNSQKMQEAIVSSLMCIDKNNSNNRLHRFLAGWAPKQVSPDFLVAFREYVRSKKVHTWKNILSWEI